MGRRDARHPAAGSRLATWLPVALVLGALVAGAITLWQEPPPDPAEQPEAVAPPAGLVLPAVASPAPLLAPAEGRPDPAKVRRALAPLLRDSDLGPHVLATVAGLDGTLLYSAGTGTATPASTLKLLTATAALEVLGPDHTFRTTVVRDAPRRVVLVGGGDPLLSPRDVKRLARDTAAALEPGARVRVGYDLSLFSGPDISPRWPASYVPDDVVAPIQSLWIDEGRPEVGYGRVDDPAAAAAARFAQQLAKAGVRTVGDPEPHTAGDGATEVAGLASQPLDQIVEHTLLVSDNEAAEVLARQVGLAVSGDGSFLGGARAVREVLGGLGVPVQGAKTYDGSGLSRANRLDPDTITAVLELAASPEQPDLRAVLTGLPVAGFTGSLTDRFESGGADGVGYVRAKTGTLSGVSGLAGIVTDRTGAPMVFALLADRIDLVDTLGARAALDAATSALAGCRCGSRG